MSQTLPSMETIAEAVFKTIQALPQTPPDLPRMASLAEEVEITLMSPLEHLEKIGADFQMKWLAGWVPEGLMEGQLSRPVSPEMLKAARDQPGISKARAWMLDRIYEGAMAAEIVEQQAYGTDAQLRIAPMGTVPRKTRASEQPTEVQQAFLEDLMTALNRQWLKDPLLAGAMSDLIDRKPAYLMTLMEHPNDPKRLYLAPFLVTLAVLEAAIGMQEGAIDERLNRQMAEQMKTMTSAQRMQTRAQLRSQAAHQMGSMIGPALQSKHPVQAMMALNPLLATWNLSNAHLPSV